MNPLRTWRKDRKLTIEHVAQQLDISVGSLSRIERDGQWPDRDFFERMVVLTEGTVTSNDFFADAAKQPASADTVNDRSAS